MNKTAYNLQSPFPLNDLSDRNFEKLLYRISHKMIGEKESPFQIFDKSELRAGVGERGSDISLHYDNKIIGLIQCKRYKTNISRPGLIKELLKFLLHSIVDKSILPSSTKFTYFFATTTGFSEPALKLLNDFNHEILKENNLDIWLGEIIRSNKKLSHLKVDEVKDQVRETILKIKVERIIPADINSWLSNHSQIASEFWDLKKIHIIDNETKTGLQKIISGNKHLQIGILIIFFLLMITLYFVTSGSNIKKIDQAESSNTFAEESISTSTTFDIYNSNFKILLLPFNPDNNCTYQETDYESKIIERFTNHKEYKNSKIDIRFYKSEICPSTNDEARRIAIEQNANLIIWGYYDENCTGPTKVRIRYKSVSIQEYENERASGDSKMNDLEDINQLRSGYLQNDIDYIIYWSLAKSRIEKGQYKEALEYLLEIKNSTCDIALYKSLTQCYYKVKNFEKAFPIVQEAIRCDSLRELFFIEDAELFAFRGLINLALNMQEEAYNDFHQAFDFTYDFQKTDIIKLIIKAYNGNEGLILSELLQSLPENNDIIYCAKGELLKENKNLQEAIKAFTQAINTNDTVVSYYIERGELFLNLGQLLNATNDFKQVKNRDGNSSYLSKIDIHKGDKYLKSMNLDSALIHYNNAIILAPNEGWHYLKKARFFQHYKADIDSSLFYFSKFIQLDSSEYSYELRGEFYLENKKYDLAIKDFQKALSLNKYDKFSDNFKIANIYEQKGDSLTALSLYKRLTNIQPKSFNDYINLAKAFDKIGDKDNALKNYTNGIHLDPNSDYGYRLRGSYQYDQGNYKEVILDFNKSISISSKIISDYNIRGLAYSNLKKYKLAIADFDKYLELKPDSEVVSMNRRITIKEKLQNDYPILKYFIWFGSGDIAHFLICILFIFNSFRLFKKIKINKKKLFLDKQYLNLVKKRKHKRVKKFKTKYYSFFSKFNLGKNEFDFYKNLYCFEIMFSMFSLISCHLFFLIGSLSHSKTNKLDFYKTILTRTWNENNFPEFYNLFAPILFFILISILIIISYKFKENRKYWILNFFPIILEKIFSSKSRWGLLKIKFLLILILICSIYFTLITNSYNSKILFNDIELFQIPVFNYFILVYASYLYIGLLIDKEMGVSKITFK